MHTATHPSAPQCAVNPKILDVLIHECTGLLERSEEGQRLLEVRRKLTDPIYKKFGHEVGDEFENLINGTIDLYGEGMFAYGLAIGRDGDVALNLPDSGYSL